ncbi:MAG: CinA family nicotinamide mononucleotide deamidase-related protein [Chitinophagaceae bacterium]|nr:CinA family nicotinamide mononucleotide deamidase-related protein [Chitinophagaceae bacterium]
MKKYRASIITIGDEILIGQVIDTNSAVIAAELNKIGIWVHRKLAVGDDTQAIIESLKEEEQHSDIILITGGLGPTKDDITKQVLCEYFGGKLIVNEKVKEYVLYLFNEVYRRPVIEVNLKQAEVPDVCEVIHNKRGSAPGMIFRKKDKIFFSMPGVPHEMKGMMEDDIVPMLQKEFITQNIIHRTLLTAGVGESFLAEKIKDFENALPTWIKLAYLPNNSMVRLRLTASGENIDKEINSQFEQLKKQVADFLVADEDITLETKLGKILNEQKKTMATAESCTGGYIAHLLTANPKSSSFFTGSVVCYDKRIKESVLDVDHDLLEKEGTVNETVVIQMVKGILKLMGSDYGLAVTGLMGPDAGGEDKPVGTVWIGVGNREKIETQEFHFRFDRRRNIEITAVNALNMMRKFILKKVDS